ncbi:MAG: hypothetical protein EAZ60_13575, partial [Oscillatoriales cyanobacterium]
PTYEDEAIALEPVVEYIKDASFVLGASDCDCHYANLQIDIITTDWSLVISPQPLPLLSRKRAGL